MAFIQVEGINMGAAIFDTNQLSIIRGGSLLLKKAIEHLSEEVKKKDSALELTGISTGASSGIYEAKSLCSLDDLTNKVVDTLTNDPDYRHFTFAVVATEEQNFLKAKEILKAKIRLLQLRQLAAAPDPGDCNDDKATACTLEGIRKAYKEHETPPKGYTDSKLSESCIARFDYGREHRGGLYQAEFEAARKNGYEGFDEFESLNLPFSDDFSDIAESGLHGNLNNKLAVVYFDGNGFGKIQDWFVGGPESQTEFDRQIKELRCRFLKDLIDRWRTHSETKRGDMKLMRLETLLWGGDEMTFVVPAWRGLELVRLFYQTEWRIDKRNNESEQLITKNLTHAGGIVFCNYKTPIARMTDLAKQLAEDVKEYRNGQGRKSNCFNYTVLESIDYPAERLEAYFERRYGDLSLAWQPLQADALAAAGDKDLSLLRLLLHELPRGQIYELARLATQFRFEGERGEGKLIITKSDDPQTIDDAVFRFVRQTERLQKLYAFKDNPFSQLNGLLARVAGFPEIKTRIIYFPKRNETLLGELLTQKKVNTVQLKPEDVCTLGVTNAAWRWVHLTELWDYLAPQESQGENP